MVLHYKTMWNDTEHATPFENQSKIICIHTAIWNVWLQLNATCTIGNQVICPWKTKPKTHTCWSQKNSLCHWIFHTSLPAPQLLYPRDPWYPQCWHLCFSPHKIWTAPNSSGRLSNTGAGGIHSSNPIKNNQWDSFHWQKHQQCHTVIHFIITKRYHFQGWSSIFNGDRGWCFSKGATKWDNKITTKVTHSKACNQHKSIQDFQRTILWRKNHTVWLH